MTIEARDDVRPSLLAPRRIEDGDLADLLTAYQYLQGQNARMAVGLSARLGIGPADLRVLLFLSRMPDATPREVALQLELTSGSVTALIDRVETSGLVERREHPTDRRSLLVRLTPAGEDVVRTVRGSYRGAFDGIFSGEEMARAADMLRALGAALGPATAALHAG